MVIRATGASVSVPQPRCSASATASCRGSGAGDPPGERRATARVAFTTRIATCLKVASAIWWAPSRRVSQ